MHAFPVIPILIWFALSFVSYRLLGSSRFRDVVLSLVHLLAIERIFFSSDWSAFSAESGKEFLVFFGFVFFHYLILLASTKWTPLRVFSFWYPILLLVFAKYVPGSFLLDWKWIGLSYMAFRLSYLSVEFSNGRVSIPSVFIYLQFAFFLPTFLMGPISPYQIFKESLDKPLSADWLNSLFRILLGFSKIVFLGTLARQLSFSGLWVDGHPHPPIDVLVSSVAYLAFLYWNFSGFCDIAIAGSRLLGLKVKENFNSPIKARNIQEFWTRWHITLSEYLREVMFTPLTSKFLRWTSPKRVQHCTALSIFLVFITVGVWHGVGWNYFWFGVLHALGVVWVHYTTFYMKKYRPKLLKAYLKSPIASGFARVFNFFYISLTYMFFEKDLDTLMRLYGQIQW